MVPDQRPDAGEIALTGAPGNRDLPWRIRPRVAETTALGAAYAAGLAVGFWQDLAELRSNWIQDRRWEPQLDSSERDRQLRLWKKAVTRTFDWVDEDVR